MNYVGCLLSTGRSGAAALPVLGYTDMPNRTVHPKEGLVGGDHVMRVLLGILGVALTATLCDYTWYANHVPHNMVTGITYGVVLLTVVGAVLGFDAGRIVRGLPIGALAGVGGALTYYLLIAVMDKRTYGPAIPASWVALWFILAALDGRWLRAPNRRPWREVAIRGALAALLSGVAFYLVMTRLWGRPPATGRNYLLQFGAWAVAWAPGLLALTFRRAGVRRG